jgi:hypothetical protein
MPIIGRRPSLVVMETGETLSLISEPLVYSTPAFTATESPNSPLPLLQQDSVWPMGTRAVSTILSVNGNFQRPLPVLVQYKDAEKGGRPLKTHILHNAIDPTISYNPKTRLFDILWWWNGWTPDYRDEWLNPKDLTPTNTTDNETKPHPNKTKFLPKPPDSFYQVHSVPSEDNPAWLRSVAPKATVLPFDPRRPFWVAPMADGYMYDYFHESPDSVKIGESKVNGPMRIPNSPGARYLQDLIKRGLVDWPRPPEGQFGSPPQDWEKRGGIVGAGEHLKIASARDTPEHIPVPGVHLWTNELEMQNLPGVGIPLPPTTTMQDHLLLVNVLKAHQDHANLSFATRVLMHSRGRLIEGLTVTTKPTRFDPTGTVWPETPQSFPGTFLVIDYPEVVAAYPTKVNYQTLVNPDNMENVILDFSGYSMNFEGQGRMVDIPVDEVKDDPAVDYTIGDPSPVTAKNWDYFYNHLDRSSF